MTIEQPTALQYLKHLRDRQPKDSPDKMRIHLAALELAETASALDEATATNEKLGDLLTRIADAVKGPPEPFAVHGWQDLPELIEALVAVHGLPKPGEIPNEGVH